MQLSLLSFGYKYGLPVDADLVWDVRFMPNPNYKQNLREKTGTRRARCGGMSSEPARPNASGKNSSLW